MNNGEFRNKSIIENKRFLDEIEKGNIPNELLKKGILDAEIELENRKNEVYYSTTYQNSYNNFDISQIFQNSTQFQYQDPDLYSDDPEQFIKNALAPAKDVIVNILDAEKKEALAIVSDDNLSLAIGKKGSNIKLASRLTHYHIEIKSLSQINEEGNK